MKYLPLFIDLRRRTVLVVGGGTVAARKIRFLMSVGAKIHVVAKTLCTEIEKISHSNNRLTWIGKTFESTMLESVFLVISATKDTELNERISISAERHRIFVNVVDDQNKCSCIFPAIINRSPIIVAISSCGTSPVLARILREKIESIFPVFLGKIAYLSGIWRHRVKIKIACIADRRKFWENMFHGPFASLVSKGRLREAEKTLEHTLEKNLDTNRGEVTLVGAGPGDSGLLTLRGLQVMQQADVVLYDALVSKDVLELVRRDAEKIYVGKRSGRYSMPQKKISSLLVLLAKKGKKVVRLKGGDPFIFGRGAEELKIVSAAGIPFQVVPGITAAVGASAYAGIPLTHRDIAQSVLLLTGHPKKGLSSLNWKAIAENSNNTTLAIYMGIRNASEIRTSLMNHGKSANTPVAIISQGTFHDQCIRTGTLEQLEHLAEHTLTPALLVIGEVVSLHHEINWFGYNHYVSVEKKQCTSLVNFT